MDIKINIKIPGLLATAADISQYSRYRGAYGGRGSGKSMTFAKMAVAAAITVDISRKWHGIKMRHANIVCCREFQNSLAQSVFAEIVDAIYDMQVEHLFNIGRNFIRTKSGRVEFLFFGLARNIDSVKSVKNIIIVWLEEAEIITEKSWRILIPSVRGNDYSEIWATWNPAEEDSATKRRMIDEQQGNAFVQKINWRDNPWFPAVLELERQRCLRNNPEMYEHIWEGAYFSIGDAQVFKNKYELAVVKDAPYGTPYYFGADWGYKDPTVLVRSYVLDDVLYVQDAVFKKDLEIDQIPVLFDKVAGARKWEIQADSSRPDLIDFMRRQGFNIRGADKHARIGEKKAIESGIDYLRNFRKIVIDERLTELYEEFRKYSYKVDERTGRITPILQDEYNHGIDALRYAFSPAIKRLGAGTGWFG